MPPPWRPRNPPTTWPSRQRPGIQGGPARGIPPQHRAILPLPGSAIRPTIPATHPRKETFAPPSFPHPPSFPYPHSVIPAKAGIHGGRRGAGHPPTKPSRQRPTGTYAKVSEDRNPGRRRTAGHPPPQTLPTPDDAFRRHAPNPFPHIRRAATPRKRASGAAARRGAHPPKRHSAPPPKLPRPGNNQTPKAMPKLRGGFPPASNQLFSTLLASQPPKKNVFAIMRR